MILNKPSTAFKKTAPPPAPPKHRMDSLKTLIQLEQQRERLQLELSVVLKKVEVLQLGLFAPNRSPLYAPNASAQQPNVRTMTSAAPRTPRGALRDKLFDLMTKAGDHGINVKTISPLLGIKPVNIHSWFHSAMRRYPEIEKIAAGHYRLKSSSDASAPQTSPAVKKPRVRNRMRPKRGETTRQILKTLTEAGNGGIGAQEIAMRVGTHYRNIHVWLASTGKKTNRIERVARGIYRLKPIQPLRTDGEPLENPATTEATSRAS